MGNCPILVLGVGNILMADEGTGVHAVNRLWEGGFSKKVRSLARGTRAEKKRRIDELCPVLFAHRREL